MIRAQDIASADLDIRKFVIRVAAEVGDVLGERLAGLYLHGSLATGSFLRHESDIDVMILVDGPLSAATRNALEQTLRELNRSRPSKGELEISVIQARHAKNYEHPLPVELQLNSKHSAVPAQLMDVKQRAVRLTGDEPAYAIGAIPWYAFMSAVLADFEDKASRIDSHPVQTLLSACRTLHDASAPSIRILSKLEAAQWALEIVPQEFKPIIRDAIAAYRENASRALDRKTVEQFREYVREQSHTAFEKVRDTGEDDE